MVDGFVIGSLMAIIMVLWLIEIHLSDIKKQMEKDN